MPAGAGSRTDIQIIHPCTRWVTHAGRSQHHPVAIFIGNHLCVRKLMPELFRDMHTGVAVNDMKEPHYTCDSSASPSILEMLGCEAGAAMVSRRTGSSEALSARRKLRALLRNDMASPAPPATGSHSTCIHPVQLHLYCSRQEQTLSSFSSAATWGSCSDKAHKSELATFFSLCS